MEELIDLHRRTHTHPAPVSHPGDGPDLQDPPRNPTRRFPCMAALGTDHLWPVRPPGVRSLERRHPQRSGVSAAIPHPSPHHGPAPASTQPSGGCSTASSRPAARWRPLSPPPPPPRWPRQWGAAVGVRGAFSVVPFRDLGFGSRQKIIIYGLIFKSLLQKLPWFRWVPA